MARIGIYGGTFNPIHNTHIEIAQAAIKQFDLDTLYILTAGDPPHKVSNNNVSAFARSEMVALAFKDYPNIFIDNRELYRSSKSYSYLSLQEYKAEHENDQLFFIMGSDSLLNFKNWVKPEIISECADIIVAPREGDDIDTINECCHIYKNSFSGDFFILNYVANGLSSTYIRDNFNDEAVKSMVPESVLAYIENHNLYGNLFDYDLVLSLSKEMKDELKKSRYVHTLGVAATAYSLALKWEYPAYNAMVAGMLHDCAKCISDEERIDICKKNNIPISEIEMKFPHLLHGKVGAFWTEKKYGIKDAQIQHSIQVHTTGCINMNLLDKIIFVADYIEPGRVKQPRLNILRKVAYENLDECVFMILEDTVNYLSDNPDSIDPSTFETYEFYKKKRGI